MSDFTSVLSAAQDLPEPDRAKLLDALWDSIELDSELPFSDEWALEIERRVAELNSGNARTTPWSVIRQEALARIGYDTKARILAR